MCIEQHLPATPHLRGWGQAENQRDLVPTVPHFKAEVGGITRCLVHTWLEEASVGGLSQEHTGEACHSSWGIRTSISISEPKSTLKVIQFKLFILQTGTMTWLGIDVARVEPSVPPTHPHLATSVSAMHNMVGNLSALKTSWGMHPIFIKHLC